MANIILIIILIILPVLAYATTRSPETYQLDTYLWVLALSVLGGIVSYKEKRKAGFWFFRTENKYLDIVAFVLINLAFFILEIFTSAFSGILTFYICESANMDRLLTAAFVGLSGFAGGRMLNFMLNLAKAVLEKKFEVSVMEGRKNEAD